MLVSTRVRPETDQRVQRAMYHDRGVYSWHFSVRQRRGGATLVRVISPFTHNSGCEGNPTGMVQ